MLKAQLRSKMFQIDPKWRGIEDILTGDFFGTLDYLPRQPFLSEFLSWIVSLNQGSQSPNLTDVDWESVEFLFWPVAHTDDETAEPDLVLISNRWVLVIEVKLDSGLGTRQPWREYSVGQEFAKERGLPLDSVYYLVVARTRLNVAQTFEPDQHAQCRELLCRTFQLCWSQAISLIESWLRKGNALPPLANEHIRLLDDLVQAMRKRRTLVFSGFSFDQQVSVPEPQSDFFCPAAFQGFLIQKILARAITSTQLFLSRFRGFLYNTPPRVTALKVIFAPSQFAGFLRTTLRCYARKTMIC